MTLYNITVGWIIFSVNGYLLLIVFQAWLRRKRRKLCSISSNWFCTFRSKYNLYCCLIYFTLFPVKVSYKNPQKQFYLLKTPFFFAMSGSGCLCYAYFFIHVFQSLWNLKFTGVKSQKDWWTLYKKMINADKSQPVI